MSKRTTLLVLLALGGSASASTSARTDDDYGPRHYRRTWVELARPLELAAGRDALRVHDRGTFTQLRLQTAGGPIRIDRVIVRFSDGTSQIERVYRRLDDRARYVEVMLDGNNRRIARIIVFGTSEHTSGLQVFGI